MEQNRRLIELQSEKAELEKAGHQNAAQLVDEEIKKIGVVENVDVEDIISPKGFKFIDLTHDKPIRVSERVIVPIKEHPKFNFIGKILGPRGNSLKRMQTETGTKISILGKGSMRDKKREDDLRAENQPKFAHLHEELHILVEAFSLPPDAHSRVGHALRDLRKYLIPDNNDDIRQDQLRELAVINGTLDSPPAGRGGRGGGPMRGRGGPSGPGRGGSSSFRGGPSGPRGAGPSSGRGGFGGPRGPAPFGGPAGRPQMDSSFGFEESYDQGGYDQSYGGSSSSYMDNSGASGGGDSYYESSFGGDQGGNDFGQSYGGDQSWGGASRFKSPSNNSGPRSHPYNRF